MSKLAKPARLLVQTLNDVWNKVEDADATAVLVPFGPTESPQSKILNVSYNRLSQMINELASVLHFRYNISNGDVVSTYYHNGLPIVLSFFGITSIGGTIAPLNPEYKSQALSFYFNDSKPKLILVPGLESNDLIENECIPTAFKHNINVLRFDVDLNNGQLIFMDYKRNIMPSVSKYSTTIVRPKPSDTALILHTVQ